MTPTLPAKQVLLEFQIYTNTVIYRTAGYGHPLIGIRTKNRDYLLRYRQVTLYSYFELY